jgi:hypothetical protein
MNKFATVNEQLRRNTVALISLAIAITSLGYNTWRNEASEHNRTQRLVSIEILLMLGDLQRLTLDRHHGNNIDSEAILREAWAKVLTIRDLSQIATGSVPSSAEALFDVWSADYKYLGKDDDARSRIIDALETVRRDVHVVLRGLT